MNALAIREMEKSNQVLRSWSVGASDTQRAIESTMPQFLNAIFSLIDKVDDMSRRLAGLESAIN